MKRAATPEEDDFTFLITDDDDYEKRKSEHIRENK